MYFLCYSTSGAYNQLFSLPCMLAWQAIFCLCFFLYCIFYVFLMVSLKATSSQEIPDGSSRNCEFGRAKQQHSYTMILRV